MNLGRTNGLTGAGRRAAKARESASVLLPALIMTGALITCLAGYLTLVNYQYRAATRAQAWSLAITVAEAGIEESIAQLNGGGFTNFAGNGWSTTTNGISKQRTFDTNSYYIATIVTNSSPLFVADGYMRIPGRTNFVKRTVCVTLTNQSLFSRAVLSKGDISANGSGVVIDSYDSKNSSYSTLGNYDPAKRHDHGDVGSISGDINVPNIYGTAATGATGSASGTIGGVSWHGGHSGIQPGWYRNDLNLTIPDVTPPFTSGWTPPSGTVLGIGYTYVLGTDDYSASSISMSGKQTMLVTGKARLYVSGNFSMSGQAAIEILPGASLTVYVDGSIASISGNGVMNDAADATKFQFYGTPNLKNVSMSGNAAFIGALYAPEADLSLSGGGSSDTDFSGSVVAASVSMSGHFSIHYDEQLANLNGGYVVASWNEL